MKTKTLILFFSFILMTAFFAACGNDVLNPGCANADNYTNEIQDEVDAFGAAIEAYTTNQTTENCNQLKVAYQDYIDALRPWGPCLTGTSRDNWQTLLDGLEMELEDFVC